MHQTQTAVQHGGKNVRCLLATSRVLERGLDRLDVPVAEIAPEEVVAGLGVLVEAIRFERGVGVGDGAVEARDDPTVGER